MKQLITTLCLLLLCLPLVASNKDHKGIDELLSVKLRSDGRFDVTCVDGVQEIRSSSDIKGHLICTHITSSNKEFTLFHGGSLGGVKFCDMKVSMKFSKRSLFSVHLNLLGACRGVATTFMCEKDGLCEGEIAGSPHSLTFDDLGYNLLTLRDNIKNITGSFFSNKMALSDQVFLRPLMKAEAQGVFQITNQKLVWHTVCSEFSYSQSYDRQNAFAICKAQGRDYLSYETVSASGHKGPFATLSCLNFYHLSSCSYEELTECPSREGEVARLLKVNCR